MTVLLLDVIYGKHYTFDIQKYSQWRDILISNKNTRENLYRDYIKPRI